MKAAVSGRFGCPEWGDEAAIQLHIDYRCLRGGGDALASALAGLAAGLDGSGPGTARIESP